jgi:hypothetical protein
MAWLETTDFLGRFNSDEQDAQQILSKKVESIEDIDAPS